MRLRAIVVAVAALVSSTVGGQRLEPLEAVLQRAGAYVVAFETAFSAVVGEEHYTQVLFNPAGNGTTVQRELVSDFLLVKTRDSNTWTPFRDVFEVDGKPVRNREERLTDLIVQPTGGSGAQVMAILKESARFNLGLERTINVPVLVISFLDPDQQRRFAFKSDGFSREGIENVLVVDYHERIRPTIMRGQPGDRDLPADGRAWIESSTGRVVRTELRVRDRGLRATITTEFETQPAFGIDVPVEMREEYKPENGVRVTGRATYTHFRRFNVLVGETVNVPRTPIVEPRAGISLVEVPTGTFAMGSPDDEHGRGEDETRHDVFITKPFLLGQYEVTQEQWQKIMGSSPSHFADCGQRCPVENVNYADVESFLARLNADAGPLRYRLPTEAEWEYACRAGTTTPFATGANLTTDQANYNGTFPYAGFPAGLYRERPTAVGTFPPNAWGLADMHGNVWEWTSDWYAPYPAGSASDPRGPSSGEKKVIRGGSWYFDANSARCATRYTHAPRDRGFSLGFRIAADRTRPR